MNIDGTTLILIVGGPQKPQTLIQFSKKLFSAIITFNLFIKRRPLTFSELKK